LNFLDRFSKNTQTPNVVKNRSEGAELFNSDIETDRQTDRDKTKLTDTFRTFAYSPKYQTVKAV